MGPPKFNSLLSSIAPPVVVGRPNQYPNRDCLDRASLPIPLLWSNSTILRNRPTSGRFWIFAIKKLTTDRRETRRRWQRRLHEDEENGQVLTRRTTRKDEEGMNVQSWWQQGKKREMQTGKTRSNKDTRQWRWITYTLYKSTSLFLPFSLSSFPLFSPLSPLFPY